MRQMDDSYKAGWRAAEAWMAGESDEWQPPEWADRDAFEQGWADAEHYHEGVDDE